MSNTYIIDVAAAILIIILVSLTIYYHSTANRAASSNHVYDKSLAYFYLNYRRIDWGFTKQNVFIGDDVFNGVDYVLHYDNANDVLTITLENYLYNIEAGDNNESHVACIQDKAIVKYFKDLYNKYMEGYHA